MRVTTIIKGCYTVKVSNPDQIIIDDLAAVYDMTCCDIVKMMFSFASAMAVSRILNKINES